MISPFDPTLFNIKCLLLAVRDFEEVNLSIGLDLNFHNDTFKYSKKWNALIIGKTL